MLRHSVKWICIFLITLAILGCNNRKIKDEIEELSLTQIQEEDIEEKEVTPPPDTTQQIDTNSVTPQQPNTKEIKWYKSFDEGLKVAKKDGKPLMVDFEADWCIWCKRLDVTTYKNSQVIALSKRFIPVKVNCDKDQVTPRKYGVRGLPTIVFMNSEGQVIHQIVGYRRPEDFAFEMKKALGE